MIRYGARVLIEQKIKNNISLVSSRREGEKPIKISTANRSRQFFSYFLPAAAAYFLISFTYASEWIRGASERKRRIGLDDGFHSSEAKNIHHAIL
jgi:hypothetical protein